MSDDGVAPPPEVFISYARATNRAAAVALHERLGAAAYLDSEFIELGDRFPERLVDALFAARVVVVLADETYFRRWYCLFELRAVLAAALPDHGRGDGRSFDHAVVALPTEGLAETDAWRLPPALRVTNWPHLDDPAAIAALVRSRLAADPPTIGSLIERTVGTEAFRRTLLEASRTPPPQPFPPGHRLVPPDGPPVSLGEGFVGRSDELWAVDQALSWIASESAPVAAIEGIAGVGKSRLAAEYVRRLAPMRFPDGCFWIDARRRLVPQWHDVLRSLDPSTAGLDDPSTTPAEIRARLIAELERRGATLRAVVVVDDVPEPAADGHPPALGDLFPAVGVLPMLLTSRVRLSKYTEGSVRAVPIDTLEPAAAEALLRRGLAKRMLDGEPATVIAAWVGWLPLALNLLNAGLVHRAFTPNELLARATAGGTTSVLDASMAAVQRSYPAGALRGVTEALAVSYESLPEPTRSAARLLSWFAPLPVPEVLLRRLPHERFGPAARAELVARSFVTEADDPRFYGSMHGVLGDYLRGVATDTRNAELLAAAQAVIDLYTPEAAETPDRWPVLHDCEPHAVAVFEHTSKVPAFGDVHAVLGLALCTTFLHQTRSADAVDIGFVTLMAATDEDGTVAMTPALRLLVDRLPTALADDGQLDAAIDWQHIQVDVLGSDAATTPDRMAIARDNLADFLRRRGQPDDLAEAEGILRSTIGHWRSAHPGSVDTGAALNNLALVLMSSGRSAEAIPLLEQAVETVTAQPGHAVERIRGLVNLADAVGGTEPARAFELLRTAIAEGERLGVPDGHRNMYAALARFSQAAWRAGDRDAALAAADRIRQAGLEPPTFDEQPGTTEDHA